MYKVYLKFTRKAEVVEVGGVGVLVRDPNDLDEAFRKAREGDYAEFLVTDRQYVEPEITFSPFDPADTELDEDEDDDDEDY